MRRMGLVTKMKKRERGRWQRGPTIRSDDHEVPPFCLSVFIIISSQMLVRRHIQINFYSLKFILSRRTYPVYINRICPIKKIVPADSGL